jgi:hypothetical protein
MRALRRLRREASPSPFMFVSERGAPFTTAGFARMLERAAVSTGLGIKVHPHMLRHACGFALANQGHDTRGLQAYLGHRYIQQVHGAIVCGPQHELLPVEHSLARIPSLIGHTGLAGFLRVESEGCAVCFEKRSRFGRHGGSRAQAEPVKKAATDLQTNHGR